MRISVQADDFSVAEEYEDLRARTAGAGAIVTFTGLVRDMQGDARLSSLYLEHYPGMTERSLREIAGEAFARWPLLDATVIHRIGEMKPADQIVLVAVSSAHRQAAFEAAEFIMDYLKTRAPFWKKSRDAGGEHWVEAKDSDQQASERWKT